jgi:hypothetical protein
MSAEKVTPAAGSHRTLEEEIAALSREYPELAQTWAQALAAQTWAQALAAPPLTIYCKIYWDGIRCAKYLTVSDRKVTAEWHTEQGKTDDTIPGPGIVVRWLESGRRQDTITCDHSLIRNALEDFYAGKLELGDVPESFVREVLEVCSEPLRH